MAETWKITARNLEDNQIDPQTRQELLKWYDTITQQNYFTNNGEILIHKDGLAMGAPTSGLKAEFFLQNIEQIHLTTLADKQKIIKYFRYIDDILLIYDSDHTDTQKILDDFNTVNPKLRFTAETESDKINYLDITIHKTPIGWKTSI